MIPLGKGKPLAKCRATANGPVEFGGAQATCAVSLSKRNLSCSSESNFGGRGYADGCVVFLPQGSGSFFSANPSSRFLPSCSDVAVGQSCNPDPSATITLQDRATFVFDLRYPVRRQWHADAVFRPADNGNRDLREKVSEQTLRRFGIDPTD